MRPIIQEKMTKETLDLLVIGGGITGAGILLDAHLRGMRTGLIDMQDFAAGTSNRSTKLVHGGLRYLKQFEVGLVAEVGKERAIVYENGPHITTPVWMLLPIVKNGTYGKLATSFALYVYDRLAGVKHTERRQMLTPEETLAREPLLRKEVLKGGGYYVEYRTDDARLTLEIVKEAVARGAMALNYVKATNLLYRDGVVCGVEAHDLWTGQTYEIHAKKVVNATGPWVDTMRDIDHSKTGKTLHHTKGVHIVVDAKRFALQNPVYFDVPDGRMIFTIPREGKVYIGTTDTNYEADLAYPRMTAKDRDYLIECVNDMFPSVHLSKEDVESSWSGVRPLIHEEGKDPSEISRKDEVFTSPSGLLTIAGGKLTGYRKMADKVVGLVAKQLQVETGHTYPSCQTEHVEYSGGKFGGSQNLPAFVAKQIATGIELGLTPQEAQRLVHRYGTNIATVYGFIEQGREEAEERGMSLEVYGALTYGIAHELVITPADFFVRRTGALYFDIDWVRRWQEQVGLYMAESFGWTEETKVVYMAELQDSIRQATVVEDDNR